MGTTLRGLAASLDSGVASLYWYADNREQLLDMATAEILRRAVIESESGQSLGDSLSQVPDYRFAKHTAVKVGDSIVKVRRMILCIDGQMRFHPWLPERLLTSDPDLDGSIQYWELLGEPFLATPLSS